MKQKFTKQQHNEHGDALKQATDALAVLQALLSNSYGRDCRERSLAEKANTTLLHLRTALEARAYDEFPDDQDWMRFYFGQRIAKTTQAG